MKLTRVIILFSIPFLFANCSDEPSCPDASESYSYMPEEYKRILPYTGFDTLRFLTNTNDTIICIGQGRTTFFATEYKRDPNPDCNVYSKINYEGYKDQYNAFDIVHGASPISYSHLWLPNFKISWESCEFKLRSSTVGAKVDNTNYYDSIVVNNTKYYEVTEFKGVNQDDRLFINRASGIIKLYNSNSQKSISLINY